MPESSPFFLTRLAQSATALFVGSVVLCSAVQAQTASAPQYHAPIIAYVANLRPITAVATPPSPAQYIDLPAANLHSQVAYVYDLDQQEALYEKNSDLVRPIASITKVMTAMVVLDAQQDLDELIEITQADIDSLKHTRSRLRVGSKLSRAELVHLALLSSENRAASALGRNYPGGLPAFVRAMNEKARALGMRYTLFVEQTGLYSVNLYTALDIAIMLMAEVENTLIHQIYTNKNI